MANAALRTYCVARAPIEAWLDPLRGSAFSGPLCLWWEVALQQLRKQGNKLVASIS